MNFDHDKRDQDYAYGVAMREHRDQTKQRFATRIAADPVEPVEIEARVLGAIIARPWLFGHCEALEHDDFDDQRNRDVLDAIRHVHATHGPLPEAAVDMGLAVMLRIEGTPAADRVDLTYVASLALIAELALGDACGTCESTSDPVVPCRYVLDWFDGELDDLRAPRAVIA